LKPRPARYSPLWRVALQACRVRGARISTLAARTCTLAEESARHDLGLLTDHRRNPIEVSSSSRRGTYGFEAGLAAGEAATKLAVGKTPELIAASDLARFADGRFVGEKGAAAVGQ
jgi:hypothetical protein